MQPRCTKIGIIGVIIACVALSGSGAVQAASQVPAVCQEQDVVAVSTTPHDTAALEPLAGRLPHNLRRMHCAAQRIMEEPTLERRKPYEEVRQDAARAMQDIVTQLRLSATEAEEPPLTAFARAFHTFRVLNATIASEALLAETPAEIAAAQALSDEKGHAAFAQVYAALQPLMALLGPAAPPQGAVKAELGFPSVWTTWRTKSISHAETGRSIYYRFWFSLKNIFTPSHRTWTQRYTVFAEGTYRRAAGPPSQ